MGRLGMGQGKEASPAEKDLHRDLYAQSRAGL